MDCKEALKLMSAAIDGELSPQKDSEFHSHIKECDACRAEYEAERATKAILKSKLKRVKAPQSLVDAIKRQTLGAVGKEANVQLSVDFNSDKLFGGSAVRVAKSNWRQSLANTLFINPNLNSKANSVFALVLATSVLAMLVFAGFMRNRTGSGMFDKTGDVEVATTSNIFELTNTAFAATPEKMKTMELQSGDAQVVANYLSKSVGIHAVVPVVKEHLLAAAKVSAFGTINAGEMVFQATNKNDKKSLVSVFVAHERDVRQANVMPVGVMDYISADGRNFFTTTCSNGNQVIVWKWGETIYTATTADARLNLAQAVRNPNWEN